MEPEAELLANLRGTTRVKVDTKSKRSLTSGISPPALWQTVRHWRYRGERDQKFFKAVSQQEPIVSFESLKKLKKKRGLLDVVKGFLPSGKEKKPESEKNLKLLRRWKK